MATKNEMTETIIEALYPGLTGSVMARRNQRQLMKWKKVDLVTAFENAKKILDDRARTGQVVDNVIAHLQGRA